MKTQLRVIDLVERLESIGSGLFMGFVDNNNKYRTSSTLFFKSTAEIAASQVFSSKTLTSITVGCGNLQNIKWICHHVSFTLCTFLKKIFLKLYKVKHFFLITVSLYLYLFSIFSSINTSPFDRW